MMRNRWFAPIVIVAMFIFSAVVYNRLPAQVPSHWGVNGQIDGTMSRAWGTLFAPVLSLGIWLLILALPRLDPRRTSYEAFSGTLQLFTSVLMLFLALVHVGMLGVALGWNLPVPRMIIVGVGVLFVVLGNELGRVQPNWFVGIRTPWTLADPEVWRRTHRVGGRVFVGLGLLMILAGLVLPLELMIAVVLGCVVVILAFSFGYSYVVWRQMEKRPASH